MLHLKFALNLEHLADEMIKEISKNWKDPFKAPVVIFPDSKLEQWFQLRWIKKNGVLANFNKSSIDRFLFDILVGDDKRKKKLSSEMLANVIMAYLLGRNEDNERNYKVIDKTGQVAKYLTTNGEPDAGRLYDFANKLAGLFLEYEIARPNQYLLGPDGKVAEGILDCWSEDLLKAGKTLKDFFVKKTKNGEFESVDNESWERELYSKIFHNANGKSLLTRVFEVADNEPDPDKKVKYLTLPFLYKSCLDSSGNPHFNYDSDAPVYILGLSGMGQFYRVVLREFAKKHKVYAYIQNPCMEFWEDLDVSKIVPRVSLTHEGEKITEMEEFVPAGENDLLRNWGKAGRDNIKLWCLTDDYSTCDFSESECLALLDEELDAPKSLLNAVQYLVAKRSDRLDGSLFKKNSDDESLTVTAAPSKLREVEALHSSICKLLLDGVDAKDILVVSPNLQEYSPFIYQIFDQAKNAAENGDESIVHIPYTIVDSISKDSLVGSLIKTLFQVRKERSVSRPDFFSLVRNPVVQETRGINADMVAAWENWITEMNVYRDRPKLTIGNAPWHLCVKRLLLARLSSKTLELGDDVCTPYANMDSSNDATLLKFVETVEDLEKWTCTFDNYLTQPDIDTLLEMLNSWTRMGNVPKELINEQAAFREVCKAARQLKYFFCTGEKSIPLDVVRECLLKAATVSEFSFGNLFVNGITFMKFASNRIIPVKHLFFLGADADHFPKDDSFNTLDLRRLVRPWPGDDSSISRNRYSFLCQLMCTSEGFHISYQNLNLAKDSEIYPSPIINDLKSFVAGFVEPCKDKNGKDVDALPTEVVPLDETRSKEKIFTRRGRRYLESIACLKKPSNEDPSNKNTVGDDPKFKLSGSSSEKKFPDKVSVSQLKQYLNDPFQFYTSRMLRLEKSGDDPTEKYVEPISLSALDKSVYLKSVIFIQRGLDEDFKDVDLYFESLKEQGVIPTGKFGLGVTDEIQDKAALINTELDRYFPADKFTCQSIELNVCIDIDKDKNFILQGDIPMVFVSNENESECTVVDPSMSDKLSINKYLTLYISALGLLASGKMKKVSLFVSTGACNEKNKVLSLNVDVKDEAGNCVAKELDAEIANKILCRIYNKAFVECWKKVMPAELLSKELTSFDELKKELDDGNDHGSWNYFAGKELFIESLEKYSGYSSNNFSSDWNDARESQKVLLANLADIDFKRR